MLIESKICKNEILVLYLVSEQVEKILCSESSLNSTTVLRVRTSQYIKKLGEFESYCLNLYKEYSYKVIDVRQGFMKEVALNLNFF